MLPTGVVLTLSLLLVYVNLDYVPLSGWDEWVASNPNLQRASDFTGPSRFNLDVEAVGQILENPWIGYGMDQGASVGADLSQLVTSNGVHNTLIRSWLAGGILAFIGILLAYLLALKQAFTVVVGFMKKQLTQPYALGLAASVIAWVIVDMAQPSLYLRFTWVTVPLLYGLSTVTLSNRAHVQAATRLHLKSTQVME
jgi:O-antigen ligase